MESLVGGHQGTIKTVKFIPKQSETAPSYVLTGSDDKTIRVWKISRSLEESSNVQTVEAHTGAINCITAVRTSKNDIIVATGAADSTIRIWRFMYSNPDSPLQLFQTLQTNPKFFPLCLAISELGQSKGSLILAAGGTRNSIHIFTRDTIISSETNENSVSFSPAAILSGHEGWICSLDIALEKATDPESDLLIASASQDKYIRLWRIHPGAHLPPLSAGAESAFVGGARSPANKAHKFSTQGAGPYSITFEALLLGHEDWVYSAKWHMHKEAGKCHLQLLSTSADNSLAIWEADTESGIWVSAVRLGEISREKGATTATGSTGGFWTGLWSPDGTAVITLGRTGGWRMWRRCTNLTTASDGPERWSQHVAIGGHVRPVSGLTWEKEGRYLLTTSHDQTTRLHARWVKSGGCGTWHEMARPQIHGYDLNCISSISETSFVSGADEKLLRVFQMPKGVADLLQRVSEFDIVSQKKDVNTVKQNGLRAPGPPILPDAANMPVLGLSNKAIVPETAETDISDPSQPASNEGQDSTGILRDALQGVSYPPHEDTLSRHTLFPEIEKLYGHGYEISCCSVSKNGRLIASASRATSLEHAVIRVMETEHWTEAVRPPLKMHTLTCNRVRFSPISGSPGTSNEQLVLSVGRDRAWGVFARAREPLIAKAKNKECKSDDINFSLVYSTQKAHSRMILDCAWFPTGKAFVTAGRDKYVKMWTLPSSSVENNDHTVTVIPSKVIVTETSSVTAVDFLPVAVEENTDEGVRHMHALAVGTEAGKISVHLIRIFDSGNGLDAAIKAVAVNSR